MLSLGLSVSQVALFTRAWIEINYSKCGGNVILSPSSRGRGLKLRSLSIAKNALTVALFTRAWIEIDEDTLPRVFCHVALFTRAWIEITSRSLTAIQARVALFTRAWIEIEKGKRYGKICHSRPLHEGVD